VGLKRERNLSLKERYLKEVAVALADAVREKLVVAISNGELR